ncbi:phage tail protein [Leptolyngbyaceae cyanobacterium UHCC 1019]
MDANGLRFWMLTQAEHWQIASDSPSLVYNRECDRLHLASRRPSRLASPAPSGATPESTARSRLEQVPQTRDRYDTRAFWDATAKQIKATGALPTAIPIIGLSTDERPTSLIMGYDDVLYGALETGVVLLVDRRERWQPFRLIAENFHPWRLAADSSGGVWVLDRTRHLIGRTQGLPRSPHTLIASPSDQFRTCPDALTAPKLTIWTKAILPVGEEPVAIACSPDGVLAVLTWVGERSQIRCLNQFGEWTTAVILEDTQFAYSLTWVDNQRIAVLLPHLTTEALVYEVVESINQSLASMQQDGVLSSVWVKTKHPSVAAIGDFHPLRDFTNSAFVAGVTLPPHYLVPKGTAPLYPLSLQTFVESGETLGGSQVGDQWLPIDSGSTQTVWHRLYLEAIIPPHCGIQIFLAATDSHQIETVQNWYEHQVGETFAAGDGTTPRAVWMSATSEVPYHPGLLNMPPDPQKSGLFTVLIQRANRTVRSLQGRYLWVRVRLTGDGSHTPELAALRAYGSRFSYLNQYLPELYREQVFGSDRDQVGRSTPADFLERFLGNIEGILTPLEDKIASAYLLSDPRTAPEEVLEWLGSWIGISFDSVYPVNRRKQLLQAAPTLFRKRGTLAGLKLALELATGSISGGEIVVLENFRLRRTFATILGADLANETDPLLGGLVISGNSYVGDTLILGDETHREFLALFSADLPNRLLQRAAPATQTRRPNATTQSTTAAIGEFFDELAYRVTVFVHQEVEPQNLGLIRRVVELETPAHVEARVVTTSHPFLISVASLVGVDTYLTSEVKPRAVRVGRSRVGLNDVIQRPASLDPRLEGGIDPAVYKQRSPTADIAAPTAIAQGQSFQLDASTSQATTGRNLTRYIWKLIQQP